MFTTVLVDLPKTTHPVSFAPKPGRKPADTPISAPSLGVTVDLFTRCGDSAFEPSAKRTHGETGGIKRVGNRPGTSATSGWTSVSSRGFRCGATGLQVGRDPSPNGSTKKPGHVPQKPGTSFSLRAVRQFRRCTIDRVTPCQWIDRIRWSE